MKETQQENRFLMLVTSKKKLHLYERSFKFSHALSPECTLSVDIQLVVQDGSEGTEIPSCNVTKGYGQRGQPKLSHSRICAGARQE